MRSERFDWGWLAEEIAVAWAENSEYVGELLDEQGFWEDECDNPTGTELPDLDERGRPFEL